MRAIRYTAVLVLSACAGRAAFAQMPVDDVTWRDRCVALNASGSAIDKGSASPELLATTKGITGDKFGAVAHERAGAGQHEIACVLYYTAAMADHMGNGGKIDINHAHSYFVLASVEYKRATGQSLSFGERMDTTANKLPSLSKKTPLAPADVAEVFGAFPPSALPPSPPAPPDAGLSTPAAAPPPAKSKPR